jgi:signal transduction histidine kinase
MHIDVEAVLDTVARQARGMVCARTAVVELQEPGEMVLAAAAGAVPRHLIGIRLPSSKTLAAKSLRGLATERLEDDLNRARFNQHGLGRLGIRAEAGLIVPLVSEAGACGALIVLERLEDGPRFSAHDARLLEAYALGAAGAIAATQATAAECSRQRLGAAEVERRRWARELHDETLQSLAMLKLRLRAARRAGSPDGLADAVDGVVEQLDCEIASLRALITDLRPAALDELGIVAALQALASRFEQRGISVAMMLERGGSSPGGASGFDTGAPGYGTELDTTIYRIVQEALTNVIKHAHAARAVVTLTETDLAVHVSVSDDGAGFAPGQGTAGFGLLGMAERAELVDGLLDVQSSPGCGTTVTAALPKRHRQRPPRPHLPVPAIAGSSSKTGVVD